MEQHTLLLAAEDLPLLSDLDLHSYSNILVMVFAKDKGLPVATARQLLAIQSHNAINIELNIPSAAMPNPELCFCASCRTHFWLLTRDNYHSVWFTGIAVCY